MYELIRVSESCYYIDSPAKIGVYRAGENGVYLIDSGSDKEAGRKIRKILDQNGWALKGILSTHSNADHIGGCQYLQKQYGCPVFSGGIEACFTEHTILEPAFLFGGYPCKDLRHKFLLAQECTVTDFSDPAFPREIEIIPLPGHYFDMVGYRMPDGTVFLADCISSAETLQKYAVSFIYDVQAYLSTLDMVETMQAPVFVPAHCAAGSDLKELIQLNRAKVHEIADVLLEICHQPLNFEEILRRLFIHYDLALTMQQYVLVGSTVKSYLSWLKDGGRIEILIEDHRVLWKTI